ncbi:PREDICTED: uncharacterized protein LOC108966015 [Bactrocera latifrons]|uniref:uncharacterized protein LOC108966015 n=1 Tax=Bactrocera latifrons TaxID=174628 RepID=UPI0008DDB6AA|nr:PREDICTED: uncharacterized protein LOC108966015 [Bactrocera latifrons]
MKVKLANLKFNAHDIKKWRNLNMQNKAIYSHKKFTKFSVLCMLILTLYLFCDPFNYTTNVYHTILYGVDKNVKDGFSLGPAQSKYYIHTSQCCMPYVNPFSAEALKIFRPENYDYTNCTSDEAFITSSYQLNARQYLLHMNMEAIERAVKPLNATATDVRCCYQQIVRAGSGGTADKEHNLLNCTTFQQDFLVPIHIEYIVTECFIDTKPIQADAFSFIQTQKLLNSSKTSANIRSAKPSTIRKPSILLVGIDSMSRINLRRTMPLTAKYLEMSEEWIEFQGYNKVGDNTFPNLMPLLTSYNESMAHEKCKPTTVGGLNQPVCNFIWNNFKQAGYITAYSEDVVSINTFNYKKIGFEHPPTDYYLRPMTLGIEKTLKVQSKDGLPYCVGRRHYGDYIFDSALQFANVFTEQRTFGLFWTNSFSHNAFDTAATMDLKVLEYLQKFKSEGILDRSIVLFLSDHGVRWGSLVKLTSGFLEERLPMFFISLPPWYQNEHPDFVKNLKINQHRLTTPYDIYATLKHILEEADSEIQVPYVNGSTSGYSIFREIPEERTCEDASIPEHWCTCISYETVPVSDAVAKNVTALVLGEMNQYLVNKNISDICAELKLEKINSVEMKMIKVSNESTYRINFEANAEKARFQATVVYNITTSTIKTDVEVISRLDSYARTSKCIEDEEKKYCICKNNTRTKL